MVLPDYQTLMLPLMQTIADERVHDLNDIIEVLAKQFTLNDRERAEMLPSGKQRTFDNRAGWARTYLKKAGLLETPGVGKVNNACGNRVVEEESHANRQEIPDAIPNICRVSEGPTKNTLERDGNGRGQEPL